MLAGVFVMLAILVVPTLRSYLRQQSQIDALNEQVLDQRADLAQLQRDQARWSDPAFVEQQARGRLGFVKPGERSYIVVQPDAPEAATAGVAVAPSGRQDDPWYGRMWESARIADQGAGEGAEAPAQ